MAAESMTYIFNRVKQQWTNGCQYVELQAIFKVGNFFDLRKKGGKAKKRMQEEEIEKGDCGPPTWKVFFKILSDLNQAVPNHLADESQTC